MKKIGLIGCLLWAACSGWCQNTLIPSVSNYHLTWTTINPAFSGYQDALSITTMYRSPMYQTEGPQDMQLNLHTPVKNAKVALGGVVALNTVPGTQNLYSVMTTYAYRINLKRGRLAFGLSAGMHGISNDPDGKKLRDGNDPSFPEEVYQRWHPNFGAGILYHTEDLFVGFSVPELLAIPDDGEGVGYFNTQDYRYLLIGAYQFNFSEDFRLKPSLLVDYSRSSVAFKASLTAGLLDSRIYFGGAYAYPNFVIALLNFQVSRQWLLGYAYAFNTGEISKLFGGGSHEIVLRWEWRPVIRTIPEDPFYF